jgi:hypothetical protein
MGSSRQRFAPVGELFCSSLFRRRFFVLILTWMKFWGSSTGSSSLLRLADCEGGTGWTMGRFFVGGEGTDDTGASGTYAWLR